METNHEQWAVAALLKAYAEHLRDSRGLCSGTRGVYAGCVEEFLRIIKTDSGVDPASIRASDVIGFVDSAAKHYGGSRTVEHVATSLRSFH